MLKFKIDKKAFDGLEDSLKAMYQSNSDGNYYLEVEGAVAKEKLDEFRNNNINLTRQLESFSGVDLEEYKKARETQKALEEKKLLDAGEVDKVVEQRVTAMKTDLEGKLKEKDQKLVAANRQLDVLIIDNSVREHATKLGVAASAVDDVLLRARTVYQVEDGRAIPKDRNGAVIFGKDGSSPLPIADWIGGLKDVAPHLFQPSKGSGGSGDGGPGTIRNTAGMSAQSKIAQGLTDGTSPALS
jgi:hypothetical protein